MTNNPSELPPLLGSSRPVLELMERVSRVAPLERSVLVVGERGTGKELVATRLHFLSGRWDQRLVKLNCAALPESLLETELFGHEAGAFTGATRSRPGRFELADGGTLVLDEIANASARVQEQVLRIIEYGEFERVGSSTTRTVDVRVVGATNEDLPAAARAGRFRHDLLDRLAFDVLTVPPLRAREDDVVLLAEHFGRAMAFEIGWPAFPGFADEALVRLRAHPWPGNVRELKNVVERAVYRAEGDRPIDALAFDPFESPYRPSPRLEPHAERVTPDVQAPVDPPRTLPGDFRAQVAAFERDLLERAMFDNRHSQKETAEALGLSYHQLRYELKKHDLLSVRRRPEV